MVEKGGRGAFWIVLSVACASSELPRPLRPQPSDPLEHLVRTSPLGASPDRDVLTLEAAEAWLSARFEPNRDHDEKTLRRLAAILGRGGELEIEYHPLAVYGAAETFQTREGNCLSQTTLFVAMARRLGFKVYFREVYQAADWIREGNLHIRNRHVAARVYLRGRGAWEVDFGETRARPEALGRSLTDVEARALHFNNLGAAALSRNANEEAVRHFNRALLLDPKMAFGWANLGTAYLRLEQQDEAEIALRRSATLDPYDLSALYGLERLYTEAGAEDLAAAMRSRSERVRDEDPFRQHERGLTALREGRPEVAVRHLERAFAALPKLIEVRTDLARAYYRANRLQRSRRLFHEAHALARTTDERNTVKQALLSLQKAEREPDSTLRPVREEAPRPAPAPGPCAPAPECPKH